VAEAMAVREIADGICAPLFSRAMASRPWLGAVVCAGLAGCVPIDRLPPGQVRVAPGVVFSLPSPAALGRSVAAQQLVIAHYRNETFAFQTSIRVTPTRLLVVGTDMLGRRAMTIEWTGDDLTADSSPWVPADLRAANVMADIMLLHWPADAVRAGLVPDVIVRTTAPAHRVVAMAGHDLIDMDRTAGASGSWSGRWTYRNLAWGYELVIQSVEATP
jgi:hypothetical protein